MVNLSQHECKVYIVCSFNLFKKDVLKNKLSITLSLVFIWVETIIVSAASITPRAVLVTLVQTIGNSNEIYKCPNWIFYIVESFNLIHFQAKTFEASASRGTFN